METDNNLAQELLEAKKELEQYKQSEAKEALVAEVLKQVKEEEGAAEETPAEEGEEKPAEEGTEEKPEADKESEKKPEADGEKEAEPAAEPKGEVADEPAATGEVAEFRVEKSGGGHEMFILGDASKNGMIEFTEDWEKL